MSENFILKRKLLLQVFAGSNGECLGICIKFGDFTVFEINLVSFGNVLLGLFTNQQVFI